MPLDGRYQISRVITPAASIDLVTLDQAKAALGIDSADTSQDAALSQHITQISAAINRFCNRVFVEQTYRDQFRALYNWLSPGAPLMTRQAPIALDDTGLPLAIVTENGAVIDAAAWEVDPSTGQFYRLDGAVVLAWTGTTVLIDYTAGFDPVPADVQAAAVEWLTARWAVMGRDPTMRSEVIPDLISNTFGNVGGGDSSTASSIPMGTREMLAPYRIWFL